MVQSLRMVLGKYHGNAHNIDQKFCNEIKTGVPFDLALWVVNWIMYDIILLKIDYNELSICC